MLSRWQRHIVSESGDVLPGAEVEVTVAGEDTLADLYEDADGNTGKTNPFNADGGGYAFFYVAGGTYDIYVNGVKVWEHVQLGTSQRRDMADGVDQFGTASGRDIGTGTDDLPDVQAFGGPTPAEIGKGAIVESDTNANGSYVRWENGEQVCFFSSLSTTTTDTSSSGVSHSASDGWATFESPASFTQIISGSSYIDASDNGFSINRKYSDFKFTGSLTSFRVDVIDIEGDDDEVPVGLTVWGFWK